VSSEEESETLKSMSLYTKKSSPLISGPTRSQSEYRLQDLQRQQQQNPTLVRSESFSSTSSADRHSLSFNSGVAPIATPESEFDVNLSDTDSISLMSAIVSVTAKYINLDSAQRYQSPTKSASFTVGEPSDFRKLADDELIVQPPSSVATTPITTVVQQQETEAVPPPTPQPYSSHRRGAPSNDSGYLSQASTLNRGSVDAFVVSSPASSISSFASPERKSLRNSGRGKRETTEDDVPMKRIRSLSPDTYEKVAEVNSQRKPGLDAYTTNSPTTNNKTSSDVPDQNDSGTANKSSEDKHDYMNIDNVEFVSDSNSLPNSSRSTSSNRPSTLNVKAHYVHAAELNTSPLQAVNTTASGSSTTKQTVSEILLEKAGPNSIMSRLTRSKSIGTPVSPCNNKDFVVPSSPIHETMFGPKELFYQSKTTTTPLTVSSTPKECLSPTQQQKQQQQQSPAPKTPVRTHFSFTRSQSMSARSEHRRRSTVDSPISSQVERSDIAKPAAANDAGVILRATKGCESQRTRRDDKRRLSVRERAAAFGQVTSPSSPNNTSWSDQIPNTTCNQRVTAAVRAERTKSSPNLTTSCVSKEPRNEENTAASMSVDDDDEVEQQQKQQQQQQFTNVQMENITTTTSNVSEREFDLRCRVSEEGRSRHYSASAASRLESKSVDNIAMSRSTDRLVRSSLNRRHGSEFITSASDRSRTRPKSELYANFDYRPFSSDKKYNEISGITRRTDSESSSPRRKTEPFRNLRSTKSEIRLSETGTSSSGKKIGNFPLTLWTGSVQNGQTLAGRTTAARPHSLYDSLSYEMV